MKSIKRFINGAITHIEKLQIDRVFDLLNATGKVTLTVGDVFPYEQPTLKDAA